MLAAQIPSAHRSSILAVGDGTIGSLIAQLRPDVSIQGVEFLVRPECKIECCPFEGKSLPFRMVRSTFASL